MNENGIIVVSVQEVNKWDGIVNLFGFGCPIL